MNKLSLCLIVKNEEGELPRCLTAASGIVDEIIVVDTGSTDKTIDVAKEFGAQVFATEWTDFAAARNESLKHATGDWVLILDADEAIFKSDLRKLKAFLSKAEAEGYVLETRNYTNETNLAKWKPSSVVEGFEGYVPSYKIRLFRRKPEYVFSKEVHESVEPAIRKAGGKIQAIEDVVVHHYGYSSGKAKYITMLEGIEEKSIGQLYDLATSYLSAGDLAKALKTFLEVEEKKDNFRHVQRNLGTLYLKGKHFAKAGEHLKKAIEQHPTDAGAHNNLGVAFKQLGQYDQAARCFSRCAELLPQDPRPLRALALVYSDKGEKDKAKALVEKALKAFPDSRMLQETLAIL